MEALIGILFVVIVIVWVNRRVAEQRKAEQREIQEERKRAEEELRKKILMHAQAIVEPHAATLYRKKLQKTKYDDYGNTFDTDWVKKKNISTIPLQSCNS